MSNQLTITCIGAQLTRDTEAFSNMDPYVIVQCGAQKRKTRTHQEGGKRPRWNDTFTFLNPKSNQIKFAVWDEDTLTDDLVGQGTVQISKYLSSPNVPQKEYININYKGKPAGKLNVQILYKSGTTLNNNIGNNNSAGWNNNSQGWNQTNNTQGQGQSNNSQNTQNIQNTQKTPNTPNTQGWNASNNLNANNQNSSGWGNQNNSSQGWGNPNNSSQGLANQNNNSQGWGKPNTSSQGWGNTNNTNNVPTNNNWGNNIPINNNSFENQQNNTPNLQKKPSSNNESNPYGNISTNDNSMYPSLDQNKVNPIQNQNTPNPLSMALGAQIFGQANIQSPQQQNPNAFNILNMAIQQGVQPPPANNMGGWGQQNSGWGQQQGGWGQSNQVTTQNTQSSVQNGSGWGQLNKPTNSSGQNNWGAGW